MGAKEANFHAQVFARMGFDAEVDAIQDAYLPTSAGTSPTRSPQCRRRWWSRSR